MLVKTPSTVAAVEALLNDEEEGRSSAAIASGVCERLFDGVQVLFKGVQDEACESSFFCIRVFHSEGVAYLLSMSQQILRDFIFSRDRLTKSFPRPRSLVARGHIQLHKTRGWYESVNRKTMDPRSAPHTRGSATGCAEVVWRTYCRRWTYRSAD